MHRTALARRSIAPTREEKVPHRLLKDTEVEAQYGISRFTLRADRIHARKFKFKFIKIGRSVYYRIEDIEIMLDRHAIVAIAD